MSSLKKTETPESSSDNKENASTEKATTTPERRVRFDDNTKKESKSNFFFQRHRGGHRVSGDNTTAIAGMFGSLGGILFLAWGLNGIADVQPKKTSSLETYHDLLAKRLYHEFEDRGGAKALNCSLFVASSTIPGTGNGLYAGQDYPSGSIITELDTGKMVPVPTTTASTLEDSWKLWPQYSLAMKHHPTSANLVIGKDGRTLQATKSIHKGDEFLLSYDSHPMSSMSQLWGYQDPIPTKSDYEMAQGIIQDQKERLLLSWKATRDPKRSPGRGPRSRQAKPNMPEIDFTLKFLRDTVHRLNFKVARLLPDTKVKLDRHLKDENSWDYGPKKKSLSSLQLNAACLSFVEKSTSGVIAKNNFSQGQSILPTDLYVMPLEYFESLCFESQTCAAATTTTKIELAKTSCLIHSQVSAAFCPLSMAGDIVPAAGNDDETSSANVAYRWNPVNDHNSNSMSLSSMDQVLQFYTLGLSWEVYALRDIVAGEELRMDLKDWNMLPEDLIPKEWKTIV